MIGCGIYYFRESTPTAVGASPIHQMPMVVGASPIHQMPTCKVSPFEVSPFEVISSPDSIIQQICMNEMRNDLHHLTQFVGEMNQTRLARNSSDSEGCPNLDT